ncbi:MAG: AI-2E family transporter [Flavobacteriaceae bacterium]|jgi:predicted PurR-regulated permease PerM|nr:AI-2E family transporter [Flavobacteriaceae bacterium]
MLNSEKQISGNVVRQIFLLATILILGFLIGYNLSMFIPSVLGAITLYIVFRNLNFYLQEKRKWKSFLSSIFLIFICLVVLVIPLYFLIDILVAKLGDPKQYLGKLTEFLNKIQNFIYSETGFDVLSKENILGIRNLVGKFSTSVVSSTFNTLTVVFSAFFILYFMFAKARLFERLAISALPLKRVNIDRIGKKLQSLVVANAVGIPVVALGQGIVALIGYFIFGAPSPVLLFALTAIASVIPVVGAAIIYIPIGIFMIAEGNTGSGIFLMIYCIVVVGLTDNILRFTLLRKLENIHPLNTVFGIIMGMNLFGFMGLIFGPIMISITLLLIQIYKDEFVEI